MALFFVCESECAEGAPERKSDSTVGAVMGTLGGVGRSEARRHRARLRRGVACTGDVGLWSCIMYQLI